MIGQLDKHISYLNKVEKGLIHKAYDFAFEKHRLQKRRSGEDYINHPLRVATYLAQSSYDANTIAAGLLHDTIEDTDTTFEEIAIQFNREIAELVDGVTKISSVKIKDKDKVFSDEELYLKQADNYRKLLVATAKDIRVIAIKLNDRLDNIKTLQYIPENKRKFYARETIEIFAPIAERLGMGEIKGTLEDCAFKYSRPKEYINFIKIAQRVYKNPQRTVESVIPRVKQALDEHKIKYQNLSGRAKHLYSLFMKMNRKEDISSIYDIVALRVIVETIEDCYKVLGLIHSIYVPLPNRIHDYIARPKDNGYQSIHTTVKDEDGNIFEIQIRTAEMHKAAEYGKASHWDYKDKSNHNSTILRKDNDEWLNELKKLSTDTEDEIFIQKIKEELFSERVFVFTPKGDIIDLPRGSTAIDYAYKIHTGLGHKCTGAKINNRLMPLSTPLETKDVIEILTSNRSCPSKNWLTFVRTSYAKNKIKNFLRSKDKDIFYKEGDKTFSQYLSDNNLIEPKLEIANDLIANSKLPFNDYNTAITAIGEGNLSKKQLANVLFKNLIKPEQNKLRTKKEPKEDVIHALKNIRHAYAGCCKPKARDKKVGYLTRDHLIKIHKLNCKWIATADSRRLFDLGDNEFI